MVIVLRGPPISGGGHHSTHPRPARSIPRRRRERNSRCVASPSEQRCWWQSPAVSRCSVPPPREQVQRPGTPCPRRRSPTTRSIDPEPVGTFTDLTGVACPGTSSDVSPCRFLRRRRGNSAPAARAVERIAMVDPEHPGSGGERITEFDDVACPAPQLFRSRAVDNHTLIERWNGASWSVVASPSPTAHSRLTRSRVRRRRMLRRGNRRTTAGLLEGSMAARGQCRPRPGQSIVRVQRRRLFNGQQLHGRGSRGNAALSSTSTGRAGRSSMRRRPMAASRSSTALLPNHYGMLGRWTFGRFGRLDSAVRRALQRQRLVRREHARAWYDARRAAATKKLGARACRGQRIVVPWSVAISTQLDYETWLSPSPTAPLNGWFIAWERGSYAAHLENVRCPGSVCLAVGSEYGGALVERGSYDPAVRPRRRGFAGCASRTAEPHRSDAQ